MKSFTATTAATSLLACLVWTASQSSCEAFVVSTPACKASFVSSTHSGTKLFDSKIVRDAAAAQDAAAALAAKDEQIFKAPANPDLPNLPEVKGDFDWDAKYGGDDDWITENVPGKIVMNEIELAKQVTALNKLEEKFRKVRLQQEYDDYQVTGWVGNAEILNSRFAMFFLVVGLFTESFTGDSLPGQVETMLRILGFIGFD